MPYSHVCIIFRQTAEGETALSFAADLIRRLPAKKLIIYLPEGTPVQAMLASNIGLTSPEQLQALRVLSMVASKTSLSESQLEVRMISTSPPVFPEDAILVDRYPQMNVDTIVPFDICSLESRRNGPFVIGFGFGDSGLLAAQVGIQLARQLSHRVIFYHTTWKNPAISSASPEAHLCDGARALLNRLTAHATACGVAFETVIETADDVVEGMMHCSMRSHANLIIMTHGLNTDLGSYVTQALEQSPIPLLIVSRSARGRSS